MKNKFSFLPIGFVLALSLAGCATRPEPPVICVPVDAPAEHSGPPESLWLPDQFSGYALGRYVDPHDPSVLHEGHTLYRREETGHWNLSPGGAAGDFYAATNRDSALLHDALTAELNRQRDTSRRLIEQAGDLAEQTRELNAQSQAFRTALLAYQQIRNQLETISNRVEMLESQGPVSSSETGTRSGTNSTLRP